MSRVTLLRGRVSRLLLDTYTRDRLTTVADDPGTPSVDESTGGWGEAITQEGGVTATGVSETTDGVPCLWIDAGALLRFPSGTLILEKPSIVVADADPLTVGDQVRNITDLEGNLRVAGPAVVETTSDYGPPGYSTLRLCQVRYVVAV